MSGGSGMDMNIEEIEFADHAALSAMESMIKGLAANLAAAERANISRDAYRFAKEMVVERRKFIREHIDPRALDEIEGEADDSEEDLDS